MQHTATAYHVKVSVAGTLFHTRVRCAGRMSERDVRSFACYCAWLRHGAQHLIPYWRVYVVGNPTKG